MKFRLKASGPADTAHATVSMTNPATRASPCASSTPAAIPSTAPTCSRPRGEPRLDAFSRRRQERRAEDQRRLIPARKRRSRMAFGDLRSGGTFTGSGSITNPFSMHRVVRCLGRRLDLCRPRPADHPYRHGGNR